MPGMSLSLTQSLRLEQKLEQRLVMQLTLAQIQDLDTEAGRDARREYKVLMHTLKDLDRGLFTDVPNFIYRVGKRVPKTKRTDGTRKVVAQLRRAVPLLGLDTLPDVRTLVAIGLATNEKWHLVPSEAFDEMFKVWENPKFVQTDLRRATFELLTRRAEAEDSTTRLLELLVALVEDKRIDQELCVHALTRINVTERLLDVFAQDLLEILPNPVSPEQLDRAFRILTLYDRMLGHLHLKKQTKTLKPYIENGEAPGIPEALPEVIRAFLPVGLSAATLDRLAAFCAHKDLRDSVDAQREVLRALIVLRKHNQGEAILAHLTERADSVKLFLRIMREVTSQDCYTDKQLTYPFEATNGQEILTRLANPNLYAVLGTLHLQSGYAERFLDSVVKLPPLVPKIILRLAEIYAARSPEVLPMLARITEQVLDGRFNVWRYAHHAAAKQLEPIRAHPLWQENTHAHRILGRADEAAAQLRAVKLLQVEAVEIFAREFKQVWRPELGSELEVRIVEIEAALKKEDTLLGEKRELGATAKQLRTVYKAARLVELFDLTPTQVEFTRRVWEEAERQPWVASFGELIGRGRAVLDSPAVKSMTTVEVAETDQLTDLLQIGVLPVLSCQRWTEPTGYNKCLLAYVADPGKKLWQMRSRDGEVIGRVVVRLLPFKKSALILTEPPYANRWSNDHTSAILAEILAKAARLAEAIKKPVAVGYAGVRRWGEWGAAFEELGKQFGFKPKTTNYRPRLAESFNLYEYSDSMGGCLERGKKVDRVIRLTYIGIGVEGMDEGEAETETDTEEE